MREGRPPASTEMTETPACPSATATSPRARVAERDRDAGGRSGDDAGLDGPRGITDVDHAKAIVPVCHIRVVAAELHVMGPPRRGEPRDRGQPVRGDPGDDQTVQSVGHERKVVPDGDGVCDIAVREPGEELSGSGNFDEPFKPRRQERAGPVGREGNHVRNRGVHNRRSPAPAAMKDGVAALPVRDENAVLLHDDVVGPAGRIADGHLRDQGPSRTGAAADHACGQDQGCGSQSHKGGRAGLSVRAASAILHGPCRFIN